MAKKLTSSSRRSSRGAMPHVARVQDGFTGHRADYEKLGADLHDQYAAADAALSKRVFATLQQHYPFHTWNVEVNHAGGIVKIRLDVVMPKSRWFVLHIARLASDPGLRSVIRAGGDLLERYNLPRRAFHLDHFLAARSQTFVGRAEAAARARTKLILPGHPAYY